MPTSKMPTLWCILFLFVLFATITQSRDVAQAITAYGDNTTAKGWPVAKIGEVPLTFDEAHDKGSCHLDRLEYGDTDQSVFTDRAMLNDNGWTAPNGGRSEPGPSLEVTYDALGIMPDAVDHFDYDWHQDRSGRTQQSYGTTRYGAQFGATLAEYRNKLNPKAGMLVCLWNYGPDWTIQRNGGRGPIPPLWRFSDVLWLQWKAAAQSAGESVSNIKYFIRNGVADTDSLAVLGEIEQSGYPIKAWPGFTFEMHEGGTKESIARALLGTPNGNGIVFFLAQHLRQTGKRLTVSKVQFWGNPADRKLLFYIEEVPS
ncbi:hypothetical protein LTR17_010711 [Elasticomyces elasticus]|nr:hypothetical protein LTR17_010711 [Elasticomyces elasticus]